MPATFCRQRLRKRQLGRWAIRFTFLGARHIFRVHGQEAAMTSPLSHTEIWTAIDALAKRFDMESVGHGQDGGPGPHQLQPFQARRGESRPRWPSTESLAKVLEATGVGFSEFAALTERALSALQSARRAADRLRPGRGRGHVRRDRRADRRGVGRDRFSGSGDEGVYALEITRRRPGPDLPRRRPHPGLAVGRAAPGDSGRWCGPRAASCWSRSWRGSRPAASNWLALEARRPGSDAGPGRGRVDRPNPDWASQ